MASKKGDSSGGIVSESRQLRVVAAAGFAALSPVFVPYAIVVLVVVAAGVT
jgi:hypothetical protein